MHTGQLDFCNPAYGGHNRATRIDDTYLQDAIAHPERVARLVVLNSFPFFGPQARLWLGYQLLRRMPWGVMPLVRQLTAWRMHSPHTGPEELRRFHALMRATTLSRTTALKSSSLFSKYR